VGLEVKLLKDAIQDLGNQVRALTYALKMKDILSDAALAAAKAEVEAEQALKRAVHPAVREIEEKRQRLEDAAYRIQKEVELECETQRVQAELEKEFKAETP
jgi:hypothetical protein